MADVLARDAGAVRQGLEHRGLDLNLGFLVERLDERGHDKADELAEISRVDRLALGRDALLQHGSLTRAEDVRERRHGSLAHVLVEVEIEERHHGLHHGLEVRQESILELVDVAAEHVARGSLLLQHGRSDGDAFVPHGDDLDVVLLLFLSGVLRVRHLDVRLELSRLEQRRHDNLKVLDEIASQALAQPRPRLLHVRRRGVVVLEPASLQLHQEVHHLAGVGRESFLADSHAHERDALHSLGAEHPVLLSRGAHEYLLQEREHGRVVLRERRLRVVRDGRQRSERGFLHHAVPALEHLEQLVHERVQVRLHVLWGASLGEVDHRRGRVRLDPVGRVLHALEQDGEDLRVRLLLDLGAEVGAQLADSVHRRPADARVGIGGGRAEARGHRPRDVLFHSLDASLRDLRHRHERRVTLTPVPVLQERRDGRRRARQDGVSAERDGDAVEALLPDVVPLALADVAVLLLLRGVPLLFVLDVEQEGDEAVEEAGDKVGQLAHHAGRAVAGFGEGDEELGGEVAGAVLQVVVLRDGHHGVDDVREVLAHESRVGSRELHEHGECILSGGFVAPLERAAQGLEHGGEEVLEFGPVVLVLERIHEGAAGPEGRELHFHVRSLQALREDAVQRGEVRHERVADVRGELAEHVERGHLERVGTGRDALEEEREQLWPSLLVDAGRELGDGVANLARDPLVLLLVQGLEQLGLDARLRLRLEVGPQRHLVLGQDAAEQDGRHLAGLHLRGGAQRLDELEAEHVALLLALVEQSLVLRARRVVDAGEPSEQLLEGGEVGHVQHRLDLSG
mmetsp:Transcript_2920/g.11961  ORF Transcript_2920/g.11961 Transcript_2920/m.11961 type:complete len:798 (+) Transcript_2920:1014-3407(+)